MAGRKASAHGAAVMGRTAVITVSSKPARNMSEPTAGSVGRVSQPMTRQLNADLNPQSARETGPIHVKSASIVKMGKIGG